MMTCNLTKIDKQQFGDVQVVLSSIVFVTIFIIIVIIIIIIIVIEIKIHCYGDFLYLGHFPQFWGVADNKNNGGFTPFF